VGRKGKDAPSPQTVGGAAGPLDSRTTNFAGIAYSLPCASSEEESSFKASAAIRRRTIAPISSGLNFDVVLATLYVADGHAHSWNAPEIWARA